MTKRECFYNHTTIHLYEPKTSLDGVRGAKTYCDRSKTLHVSALTRIPQRCREQHFSIAPPLNLLLTSVQNLFAVGLYSRLLACWAKTGKPQTACNAHRTNGAFDKWKCDGDTDTCEWLAQGSEASSYRFDARDASPLTLATLAL